MDFLPNIPTPESIVSRAVRIPGRKKPKRPELSPDEEKSILGDVLSSGTSALQYLGETLDKPGRAVRGLLAGKPKELANLVPFSDTMGLTNPSESVSGRDLLEKAGVVAPNTPGLDMGDVAGFGTELFTDPLSYMLGPMAALTKAGKVAKAIGISTKGVAKGISLGEHLAGAAPELLKAAEEAAGKHGAKLAELLPQKLGGAFGLTTGPLGLLGIHGTHVPAMAQTPSALKTLQTLGGLPEKAVRAVPVVGNKVADIGSATKTFLKGMFHAPSMGQFTKAGQQVAEYAHGARQAAQATAKYEALKAADAADEVSKAMHAVHGSTLGTAPEETSRIVREAMQMAGELGRSGGRPAVARALKEKMPGVAVGSPIRSSMEKVVAAMKADMDKVYAKRREMGLPAPLMFEEGGKSPIEHFYRGINTAPMGPTARRNARILGTEMGAAKARVPEIGHIPGTIMNDILTNPAMQGMRHADVVQHLMANYGEHINRAAQSKGVQAAQRAIASGQALPPLKTAADVADELAHYVVAKNGIKPKGPMPRLFNEDAVRNFADYQASGHIANANGATIHKILNSTAVPVGTPGTVRLSDVFKNSGFVVPDAEKFFAKEFGKNPAAVAIPSDIAAGVTSFMAKSQKPEWLERFGDVMDFVTEPFKRNVTLPFASFLTRNFASGQGMNVFSNEIPSIQHLHAYTKELGTARRILENPAQYKALFNELHAHGVYDMAHLESLGVKLTPGESGIPNPVSFKGFKQNVGKGIEAAKARAFNPPAGGLGDVLPKPARGVRAFAASPASIGAEFNKQVEFMNRVPMYLYLRRKLGWTAEAAAAKVRELQVDYAELAPFEKDILKRVVPFYSWQRRILPVMFSQMAQRPGGVTAQVVRASNTGRSHDEFLPPYVSEGLSVNLGGDKYLSGLGLPTDQIADLFVKGPTPLGTISRTGQKLLAQTNPLVKTPIELATKTNLFTGRPLEESYPFPTKSVLLNELIHNTPASRVATSIRKLIDERKSPGTKAWNLLTGVQITDVPGGLEKEKSRAEQKMISEILRENPNIGSRSDLYVKKDKKTGQPLPLGEDADKMLMALRAIEKRAQQEAKKKKKHPAVQ